MSVEKQPLFLKAIYLKNFRNYGETLFEFSPRCNIIFGQNAQGKTSLLEAISLLTTARSFRTQHLAELIRTDASYFYVEAEVIQGSMSQRIKLYYNGQIKKLQIGANSYGTLSPLLGMAPSVISSPEDLELINGAPQDRRRFLNVCLAQSNPIYVHHLSRYTRALKQRNALLKMKKDTEFACWETEMATSACYLHQARTQFIERLGPCILDQTQALSANQDTADLQLQTNYPEIQDAYRGALEKSRKKDMLLGLTTQGPHRDDLYFKVNQKLAKAYASEGQKKTMVVGLRLAEWISLQEQTNLLPLMLIDDFGSALDSKREEVLMQELRQMHQLFLTTPTPLHQFEDPHIITIQEGKVLQGCF